MPRGHIEASVCRAMIRQTFLIAAAVFVVGAIPLFFLAPRFVDDFAAIVFTIWLCINAAPLAVLAAKWTVNLR